MKNESGSPTTKNTALPFRFTQSAWRKVGAACIAVAAVLAWWGVEWEALRSSFVLFSIYWLVFFLFFTTAIAMVLLDIRYIRLQYLLGKRAIFQETLGDEEFRRRLKTELRDSSGPRAPKS